MPGQLIALKHTLHRLDPVRMIRRYRCYHFALWLPKQVPDAATCDNEQSEAQ